MGEDGNGTVRDVENMSKLRDVVERLFLRKENVARKLYNNIIQKNVHGGSINITQ